MPPAAPDTPAVSVMMPVYNAARYVAAAMRGVLRQTFADLELVVVDDGSTDRSLAVARRVAATDRRVRVETGPNRGVVGARNACLALARAPLLAVNDADDVSVPDRLARQVAYLRANPACVAVGGRMRFVDPDGAPLGEHFRYTDHDRIDAFHLSEARSGVGHSAALMRADAVRAVGGYREGFGPAEDFDLWLRLAEVGRLANLTARVVDYRLHERSLTATQAARQRAAAARAVAEARAR
ncbi:MAG TPA: glycosyltransferase, partial [Humisphaera sp.]